MNSTVIQAADLPASMEQYNGIFKKGLFTEHPL